MIMEALFSVKSLCIFTFFIYTNFLIQILCDDSTENLDNCGERPKNFRINRIVGGSNTYYGEVPWQALLQEKVDNAITQCGAVLIHHLWIITAAHCIRNNGKIKVFFGKHKFTDGITKSDFNWDHLTDNNSSDAVIKLLTNSQNPLIITRNASKIIVNEKFNNKTFENDIALIKLNESVNYEDNIQPICLPKPMEDFSSQTGHVSGFGVLQYGEKKISVPRILQIVSVPIISNDVCKDMFLKLGFENVVKEGILCAGVIDGGKDACAGDSGGPITVKSSEDSKWVLAGIISNGIKCGQPLLPGIYTKVSAYVDWIYQVMKDNNETQTIK